MKKQATDPRTDRERFDCEIQAARYLWQTRWRRRLRRSVPTILGWVLMFACICWSLGGCAYESTAPRPLPDGYRTQVAVHWDCEFKERKTCPRDPYVICTESGGWACVQMILPEECLCGDQLCMCPEDPEPGEESEAGLVSYGDDSPNIVGNLGTITMNGDPIEYPKKDEYDEITEEEHDLFLGEHTCPVCKRDDEKSEVYCDGVGMITLLHCGGGYYDEEGRYHAPEPCNTYSYGCRCSNSHAWGMSELR